MTINENIKDDETVYTEDMVGGESNNLPQITTAKEALAQIFADGKDSLGMKDDDIKDLESIKLIISAMLNDDLLESLTNLEPEELDDINDAFYLNEYFDNPRIDIFIMHKLKLSRSKVSDSKFDNLLKIFSAISGKSMTSSMGNDDKGIFGKRFSR